MELIRSADAFSARLATWRDEGLSIGLVPTMGALHDGHRSLIHRGRAECDRVVLYIFVNPLQFGDGEDFDRYPRDEQRDVQIAEAEGVDLLFAPTVGDMYPTGYPPTETIDPGPIGDVLEGAVRPGHFRGVLTVVDRLFAITGPCRAYFGEKDAQQLFLITRMAAERHPQVTVLACATVRHEDGLAISSRNAYLDPEQRYVATVLTRALTGVGALITSGVRDPSILRDAIRAVIALEPLAEIEDAEIVDVDTFDTVSGDLQPGASYRALVAAQVGSARLIDNRVFKVSTSPRCGSGRCR